MNEPRVLILDIETSLMEVYSFGIRDQYLGHEQIKKDWTILSVAAKWLNEKDVWQMDARNKTEKQILKEVKKLMNEADIIVGHNSKSFDVKRLNGKFEEHKIKPPSSFQQVDTYAQSKKHFNFSSHTLDYLLQKLNSPIKKRKHSKYPGKTLWIECDKGNKQAFKEMAIYNIYDVLGTEWLYNRMLPWGVGINFNVYYGDENARCTCGATEFRKNGYTYSSTGKFQRFECKKCGSELKTRQNLIKDKKKLLTTVKR